MTPQLTQAIKLLTLNHVELQDAVSAVQGLIVETSGALTLSRSQP